MDVVSVACIGLDCAMNDSFLTTKSALPNVHAICSGIVHNAFSHVTVENSDLRRQRKPAREGENDFVVVALYGLTHSPTPLHQEQPSSSRFDQKDRAGTDEWEAGSCGFPAHLEPCDKARLRRRPQGAEL